MNDYICVIGGANVDVTCTSYEPILPEDSNPGTATTSFGGVGRNVAENLARLGQKVVFISVVGNDQNGTNLLEHAQKLGIDVSNCLVCEKPTCSYVSVCDNNGELFVAVAATDTMSQLTQEYLQSKLDVINNAKCVVIEANAWQAMSATKHITAPVFMDAVSSRKIDKCKNSLYNLRFLKLNRAEAEQISGVNVTDESSALLCTNNPLLKAVQCVCITCGKKGAYLVENGKCVFVPSYNVAAVNTSGAGDSFLSGAVLGFVKGLSAEESVKLGAACSALTVQAHGAVSEDMNIENICRIYGGKL